MKTKTMKNLLTPLVLVLLLIACSKKTETNSSDEWPAMDSFHMIMAEAFHPYKDSTNLEPAKKLAAEMAAEAAKWQASELPEKVNNDEMKAQLEKLKTDTQKLADMVKAGTSDEELGAALTGLHDSFHKITEAWNGSEMKHSH